MLIHPMSTRRHLAVLGIPLLTVTGVYVIEQLMGESTAFWVGVSQERRGGMVWFGVGEGGNVFVL